MKEAQKFSGTKMYEILHNVAAIYADIDKSQKEWKQKTPASCPDGCGRCCEHFEPDVFEYEALYLAAWMLEHHGEKAEEIRLYGVQKSTSGTDGCFLFDPCNPHHCTVYGGRCLICRLFAHSGLRGKDAELRWKPCKFIEGSSRDGAHSASVWEGREYTGRELRERFGSAPPDMAHFSARLLALNPDDTETRPLREALPEAVEKLKLILRFTAPIEPDFPEPDMPSPCPLSA